uniref:Aquaporin n=1 Tax=Mesocestoides corti TaxID=53468 RepID=A0A5K3FQA2_MESCO
MSEFLGNLWQLTRRFLGEFASAFFANFPIMFRDPSRPYEPFVSSLIVGSAVHCSIFATFLISGAQINPMTTLAVVLSRRMSVLFVPLYLVAQLSGTLMALYVGYGLSPFLKNQTYLGMAMPGPGVSDKQAIISEIIITFFLELAIVGLLDELRAITYHYSNKFNAFLLLVMVFFWIDTIAIYLIGPPIGSALAVIVYETFLSEDASIVRLMAMFNFRKPFNRHMFYWTPEASGLPPQTQNANIYLDYFRISELSSTLSGKTDSDENDSFVVRSITPFSSTQDSNKSRFLLLKSHLNSDSEGQMPMPKTRKGKSEKSGGVFSKEEGDLSKNPPLSVDALQSDE